MLEKLSEYQLPALDFCWKVKTAALFAEQRTGKTWITVALIEKLLPTNPKVLIVGPLTNKFSTWVTTLEAELPGVVIATDWETFKAVPAGETAVLVIHYEMLDKLIGRLKRVPWALIVCDESQRIKQRSSLGSRRMRQLRHSAPRKLLLSGTPMDDSQMDLWAQFRFVAPEVFGDKWSDFEDEYLKRTGFMGYKRKFIKSKAKKFLSKIKPYSITLTKEDAGIIPPVVIKAPVDLTGDQLDIYEELSEHDVTRVRGRRVKADMEGILITKLQQTCGGSLIDDGGEVHRVGNAKEKKVRSILKRERPPFVIFCRYRQEIVALERLCRRHYPRVEILWGKVKDKKKKKARTELQQRFQRGEIDVLIVQIKTGGVGLDLFTGNTGIMYSTTYSWIDFDQAMARMNHVTRTIPPRIFLIYARDTIDEDIYDILCGKEGGTKVVLMALRRRRRINR